MTLVKVDYLCSSKIHHLTHRRADGPHRFILIGLSSFASVANYTAITKWQNVETDTSNHVTQ